jgi:myo-inositol-1(or 4)-monophosphatase
VKDIGTTLSDLPHLMEIAETAARQAGAYLVQNVGSARVTYQKSLNDDLLDVDLEAERLILSHLQTEASHIGVLSEESGHQGRRDTYWIIDPLDGSANFQHGSPLFAVAIALVNTHVTVGSVIYLPVQDEMFTAKQGQGAYLNSTPVNVSTITSMEKAIVHVGDISKEGNPTITDKRLGDIITLVKHSRRIRMIGTAATDLAYIACGRADMLVNHASTPWDMEAGKLLLLEAGGKVTLKRRRNNEILGIYSNGLIHQEAESLLLHEQ